MKENENYIEKMFIETLEKVSSDIRINAYVTGTAQFTDLTNATFFNKLYGHKVKYCKPWKKFLVYNGKKWKLDEYGDADVLIDQLSREMYKGARTITDMRLRIDFENHLKKSESLRRRVATLSSYSRFEEARITVNDMDKDEFLFNVDNGTIDLQSGTFREHNPQDLITKCSKFVYDPKAECPTWKRFLLQILDNDADLIKFVQKAMGYSLSSSVKEQVMFILWGGGANGKSTFLNVISALMADYAMQSRTETFMKKVGETLGNDIAHLHGARLVTTNEVEQGKTLSESLIKQATGNDPMTARFLYGEYFTFLPSFKIFMATNHKPLIKGNDHGIWRRLRLIPFTVTIPDHLRDKDLTEKLKEENSGILNWLLEGFQLWQKEGLGSAQKVQNATQDYQDEMDIVGSFIRDCLDIDASGKTRITNKEIYSIFQKWTTEVDEKPYSQKYLALRLKEKGFNQRSGNNDRYWLGLSAKA